MNIILFVYRRFRFGQGGVVYPGGGYIQSLGSSYNETLSVMDDLFTNDWIDLR